MQRYLCRVVAPVCSAVTFTGNSHPATGHAQLRCEAPLAAATAGVTAMTLQPRQPLLFSGTRVLRSSTVALAAGPPPAACDCGRTKDELDAQLREYNALVPDSGVPTPKAKNVFDQTFQSRSEARPKCSKHGRLIAEHPAAKDPVAAGAPIDLKELASIKQPGPSSPVKWREVGGEMIFAGRSDFCIGVKTRIDKLLQRSTAPVPQSTKALVFATVSGGGKTRAMLELKKNIKPFFPTTNLVVAYLGFNSGLPLSSEELAYMVSKEGARDVLARRLLCATVVSHNNPGAITALPSYDELYRGKQIPPAEESLQHLVELLAASPSSPLVVVAGVDEVQLLDSDTTIDGKGVGRLFLSFLRQWQSDAHWWNRGLRVLGIGTGVTLDFSFEVTTGANVQLTGGDASVIAEADFKKIVQEAVQSLSAEELAKRVGHNVCQDELIEMMTAMMWPRVRLVEWWRDGEQLHTCTDANWVAHVEWLQHWMRDVDMNILTDQHLLPGRGGSSIHALFQFVDGKEFKVIPDGYNSKDLVWQLEKQLPVPHLYDNLVVPLNPKDYPSIDNSDFERSGFHVVGTALHVGLQTLLALPTPAGSVNEKRLGLAKWLIDHGVTTTEAPKVVGIGAGEKGPFYPFAGVEQDSLLAEIASLITASAASPQPVYIRCGTQTCCDYLYLYPAKNGKWVAIVADAKHTSVKQHKLANTKTEPSVTKKDCDGILGAAIKVAAAAELAGVSIKHVRLLAVTNREKQRSAKNSGLQKRVNAKFGGDVSVELLNHSTFELFPFSKCLFTRRL